jgi:hypothetical protein
MFIVSWEAPKDSISLQRSEMEGEKLRSAGTGVALKEHSSINIWHRWSRIANTFGVDSYGLRRAFWS